MYKIEYNNKIKTWDTLEGAIWAFEQPITIGDRVSYNGVGHIVKGINASDVWLLETYSLPYRYANAQLKHLSIPGTVNGVYTNNVLAHLKKLRYDRVTYVNISCDIAKYEIVKPKFPIGSKVTSLFNKYTVFEVIDFKGSIYTIQSISYNGKPELIRSTFTNIPENILMAYVDPNEFAVGEIVKYKNGRDHYKVVDKSPYFKNYTLFNLNNRNKYYCVDHDRLVRV